MGKKAVVVVCLAAVSVAGAAVVVRSQMKKSSKFAQAEAVVKAVRREFDTPIANLRNLADAMNVEMHAGLASEGGSKLKMLISYVDNLPTG